MKAPFPTQLALTLTIALAAGCGGGRYGFAPEYSPYGSEDDYLDQMTQTTYVEVQRDVEGFSDTLIGWFGVVQDVRTGEDGRSLVTLTFRSLAQRNLCADERASSCRVTITRREGGLFLAVMDVRDEDLVPGEDALSPGSLLRVYGKPTTTTREGAPVVEVEHYRHWPRAYYRTVGARGNMRR